MVPKGEWDATTAYVRLDVVLYNGSSWVAIQDSTGQVPAEGSTYWQLLASGVDITNYYTKSQVDVKMAGKQDTRLEVEFTMSTDIGTGVVTYTASKSVAEVMAAMQDGRDVIGKMGQGGMISDNYDYYHIFADKYNALLWGRLSNDAEIELFVQQQSALTRHVIALQERLVSGTSIKTVNGVSLLGGGNVDVSEVEVVSFSHVIGSVDDFAADKSVGDIYNAYYANKLVVGVLHGSGEALMFVLVNCDPDSDLYHFVSPQTNYTVTLDWLGVDEYTFRRVSTVFATLQELAGKQDVSPITNAASGALTVNEYRDFGTVSALTVTLTGGTMANYDLYKFAFTCASDSTTLTLPSGVKLPVDMEMEMAAGRRFECVIDYANCLTFNCWD